MLKVGDRVRIARAIEQSIVDKRRLLGQEGIIEIVYDYESSTENDFVYVINLTKYVWAEAELDLIDPPEDDWSDE